MKRRNVTYVTTCKICLREGKYTKYFGESSRTCWERAEEHVRELKNSNEKSHMLEHMVESHPEILPEDRDQMFHMRVHKTHKSAFLRQLSEATLIMRNKRDPAVKVLNRKQEYDRCLIPSLSIEYQESEKE